MNLVIDIGNSLTKLAAHNEREVVDIERYEELSIDILDNFISRNKADRCIVSCVGKDRPEVVNYLKKLMPVLEFTSSTPIPIKNCYKTPQTLGVDRLALAVAANALHPNINVLAIDSGTAITYDFVNSNNEYIGGAISPGITTRFKALHHFTSKLPLVELNEYHPLIGSDTQGCILSGVLNGVLHEVDGYINSLKTQYSDVEVVFTGGNSFFFDKKLKNSIFVHPNLLILGLNRILTHNVEH